MCFPCRADQDAEAKMKCGSGHGEIVGRNCGTLDAESGKELCPASCDGTIEVDDCDP